MAIAYASAGAGVVTEASGGALSPLCPATVNANDILIAHCAYEGTTTTPSTPANWELLGGPYTVESAYRHWIFGKIAAGTEDGAAVAFGTPAVTTVRCARVYRFTGWVSGTITDNVPAVSFAHLSHATDPQMPSVTTTVTGALAVACIFQADDNPQAEATGMTGGTWVEFAVGGEYVQAATTPDTCLHMQTCTPTADPGTVSGGSVATLNDPVGVIGFEIRPNAPSSVDAAISVAGTATATFAATAVIAAAITLSATGVVGFNAAPVAAAEVALNSASVVGFDAVAIHGVEFGTDAGATVSFVADAGVTVESAEVAIDTVGTWLFDGASIDSAELTLQAQSAATFDALGIHAVELAIDSASVASFAAGPLYYAAIDFAAAAACEFTASSIGAAALAVVSDATSTFEATTLGPTEREFSIGATATATFTLEALASSVIGVTPVASVVMVGTDGNFAFPTQYDGLRFYDDGVVRDLCLVDVGEAPLPLWPLYKNGTIYEVYLVDTSDPDASNLYVYTSAGIKAARLKT